MLENLPAPAKDKIIELIGIFKADPRPGKVDLGVGVYKDAAGNTPVMRAVKAAEARILREQDSKAYVDMLGDAAFVAGMRELVLGTTVAPERVAGGQMPGGTGAFHQLCQIVIRARPDATVWYSDPTWPNHPAILKHLKMPARSYRYYDAGSGSVDFKAMQEDLAGAVAGDVVVLHGCCHNPTGANLSLAEWQTLTDDFAARGIVPLIDFAYQGFGDGLDADAEGLRHMAARLPESLIAVSCSKNFGLYRERVGAALIVAADADQAKLAEGNLSTLNRLNFSFPPDHGARVVATILNDPELKADWQAELEEMRTNMLTLRTGLADALRRASNSDRFDYIAEHRGMFTQLGGTLEKVAALREDHGVYMVGTGRINIAGLPADGLDRLAAAILAAGF